LKAYPVKHQFVVDSIEYLGHIVSKNGLAPDPKTVKAIKDYTRPRFVKEIRSSLGSVGFYRRDTRNFAEIGKPLTLLSQKDKQFMWTSDKEKQFEKKKRAQRAEY
jgi:hypothetical protein